jgi:hypothetical protein
MHVWMNVRMDVLIYKWMNTRWRTTAGALTDWLTACQIVCWHVCLFTSWLLYISSIFFPAISYSASSCIVSRWIWKKISCGLYSFDSKTCCIATQHTQHKSAKQNGESVIVCTCSYRRQVSLHRTLTSLSSISLNSILGGSGRLCMSTPICSLGLATT